MTHSELFAQIEQLVPTVEGWCSVERACELAAAIVALRPETSLSIGIWGGRDTLSMGLAHKFLGFGRVLAIDPYSAEASVDGEEEANRQHWSNQSMHDRVCAAFEANRRALGLGTYIKFERARSNDVIVPPGITVACLDGNHAEQAVIDTKRFILPMTPGSIAYFDDIGWTSGAVKRAVAMIETNGFVRQWDRDTGAFFRRVR